MDERESLGRLAYETFVGTRDGSVPLAGDIQSWEEQSDSWRHCWIAVAQAVAERERGGERVNNEIDEIKPVGDGEFHVHRCYYKIKLTDTVICRWCSECGKTDVVERVNGAFFSLGKWTRIVGVEEEK